MSENAQATALMGFISEPEHIVLCLLATLAANIAILLPSISALEPWVARQPWWPQARKLQKHMNMNFGYMEEDCTDEVLLNFYCFVCVVSVHHLVLGSLCLPVLISGGTWGYTLFFVGCLGEIGFDGYDFIKMFVGVINGACPVKYFIIMGLCHHTLSLSLLVPMLINYLYLTQFHVIVTSLLLAAGVAFGTGSYKFTLNTSTRSGMIRYKVIVVVQTLTVWATRAGLWFPFGIMILNKLSADGETLFFVGGIICLTLMSFFNLAMLADATEAAVKWLPMEVPQTDDEVAAVEDLKAQQHSMVPRTVSRETLGNKGLNAPSEGAELVAVTVTQEQV